MKKILFLISCFILILGINSCDKVKNKVKQKMHIPDYSYKNAKIDDFYYINKTVGSSEIIPLIKPFNFIKEGSPEKWDLATYDIFHELGNVISPTSFFNVKNIYIYGYKPFEKDEVDVKFDSPEKWFIINTQEKKIDFFDNESDFKAKLKKLNLSEELLSPDAVYEQYKTDPVLPWFPEDIKKKLEEVKAQKGE